MRRLSVEILFHQNLKLYDKDCVCEASKKFEEKYGDLFDVTIACANIDLSKYYVFEKGKIHDKYVLGESLTEDIVGRSRTDITLLLIDLPIIFAGRGILPIAMFCYDPDIKRASAIISADILHSADEESCTKNILVYIEHEIGEIVVGGHCENEECPLHFHPSVSDIRLSKEEYCEKCYRKILKNLNEKFSRK